MYTYIKRLFDVFFAFMALIILSPFFLLISLLIRLESKGSIVFKQKRVGRNNRYFNIYKFRTMRIDTPQNTPTHLLDSPEKWITKVGKILRKTSIDELPQLINILKGDMSFIGPRPALWNQYDLIGERQKLGVNILYPGLTGYAQIHGRDSISIQEKVLLDDFYAKHISFFLDLKIFILTFGKILKSDGVVEGSNLTKEKQAETLELTDDSK